MNVVLLVVDSLRARSLEGPGRPATPFLDGLSSEAVQFRQAFATECWTLPTHTSMFTGLLPSEHGAHFQHMALRGGVPTVAGLLADAGYHAEVVTRNFIFDGTIPGVTRGFAVNTQPLSDLGRLNPWTLFLALSKPRFRRLVRSSGFFHPRQRDSRRFLATFARALMPADGLALEHSLVRMREMRERRRPYFLFCNLYDVHAPYPPTSTSILRPFTSLSGLAENVLFPAITARLGAHRYLEAGFRLPDVGRRMLLGRYHRAIELMDEKLAGFYRAARDEGLLDDTILIVASDHGEAFGEHGLYLHDASVYDIHLRVPLWIRHPRAAAGVVEDVVSTRDLFTLMRQAPAGGIAGTMLDPGARGEQALAVAEHFHYPYAGVMAPQYRQNLVAAVAGRHKLVVRREGLHYYDRDRDPDEIAPLRVDLQDFENLCRRDGIAAAVIGRTLAHLRRWETTAAAA